MEHLVALWQSNVAEVPSIHHVFRCHVIPPLYGDISWGWPVVMTNGPMTGSYDWLVVNGCHVFFPQKYWVSSHPN